ncbi:PREDICTED: mucin-16 [Condylura cristata]|uniref:mucin-16 n=1 Tax=Condylura cristata TaxID=143302 RepID=UPI000642C14A|nr:PREDICTED: mucin-16 [Condylura cristata]
MSGTVTHRHPTATIVVEPEEKTIAHQAGSPEATPPVAGDVDAPATASGAGTRSAATRRFALPGETTARSSAPDDVSQTKRSSRGDADTPSYPGVSSTTTSPFPVSATSPGSGMSSPAAVTSVLTPRPVKTTGVISTSSHTTASSPASFSSSTVQRLTTVPEASTQTEATHLSKNTAETHAGSSSIGRDTPSSAHTEPVASTPEVVTSITKKDMTISTSVSDSPETAEETQSAASFNNTELASNYEKTRSTTEQSTVLSEVPTGTPGEKVRTEVITTGNIVDSTQATVSPDISTRIVTTLPTYPTEEKSGDISTIVHLGSPLVTSLATLDMDTSPTASSEGTHAAETQGYETTVSTSMTNFLKTAKIETESTSSWSSVEETSSSQKTRSITEQSTVLTQVHTRTSRDKINTEITTASNIMDSAPFTMSTNIPTEIVTKLSTTASLETPGDIITITHTDSTKIETQSTASLSSMETSSSQESRSTTEQSTVLSEVPTGTAGEKVRTEVITTGNIMDSTQATISPDTPTGAVTKLSTSHMVEPARGMTNTIQPGPPLSTSQAALDMDTSTTASHEGTRMAETQRFTLSVVTALTETAPDDVSWTKYSSLGDTNTASFREPTHARSSPYPVSTTSPGSDTSFPTALTTVLSPSPEKAMGMTGSAVHATANSHFSSSAVQTLTAALEASTQTEETHLPLATAEARVETSAPAHDAPPPLPAVSASTASVPAVVTSFTNKDLTIFTTTAAGSTVADTQPASPPGGTEETSSSLNSHLITHETAVLSELTTGSKDVSGTDLSSDNPSSPGPLQSTVPSDSPGLDAARRSTSAIMLETAGETITHLTGSGLMSGTDTSDTAPRGGARSASTQSFILSAMSAHGSSEPVDAPTSKPSSAEDTNSPPFPEPTSTMTSPFSVSTTSPESNTSFPASVTSILTPVPLKTTDVISTNLLTTTSSPPPFTKSSTVQRFTTPEASTQTWATHFSKNTAEPDVGISSSGQDTISSSLAHSESVTGAPAVVTSITNKDMTISTSLSHFTETAKMETQSAASLSSVEETNSSQETRSTTEQSTVLSEVPTGTAGEVRTEVITTGNITDSTQATVSPDTWPGIITRLSTYHTTPASLETSAFETEAHSSRTLGPRETSARLGSGSSTPTNTPASPLSTSPSHSPRTDGTSSGKILAPGGQPPSSQNTATPLETHFYVSDSVTGSAALARFSQSEHSVPAPEGTQGPRDGVLSPPEPTLAGTPNTSPAEAVSSSVPTGMSATFSASSFSEAQSGPGETATPEIIPSPVSTSPSSSTFSSADSSAVPALHETSSPSAPLTVDTSLEAETFTARPSVVVSTLETLTRPFRTLSTIVATGVTENIDLGTETKVSQVLPNSTQLTRTDDIIENFTKIPNEAAPGGTVEPTHVLASTSSVSLTAAKHASAASASPGVPRPAGTASTANAASPDGQEAPASAATEPGPETSAAGAGTAPAVSTRGPETSPSPAASEAETGAAVHVLTVSSGEPGATASWVSRATGTGPPGSRAAPTAPRSEWGSTGPPGTGAGAEASTAGSGPAAAPGVPASESSRAPSPGAEASVVVPTLTGSPGHSEASAPWATYPGAHSRWPTPAPAARPGSPGWVTAPGPGARAETSPAAQARPLSSGLPGVDGALVTSSGAGKTGPAFLTLTASPQVTSSSPVTTTSLVTGTSLVTSATVVTSTSPVTSATGVTSTSPVTTASPVSTTSPVTGISPVPSGHREHPRDADAGLCERDLGDRPEMDGAATRVDTICTYLPDPQSPGPGREQLYGELSRLTRGVTQLGPYTLARDSLCVDGYSQQATSSSRECAEAPKCPRSRVPALSLDASRPAPIPARARPGSPRLSVRALCRVLLFRGNAGETARLALPLPAATGPSLVPVTLNFTVTNLYYREAMGRPASLKFNSTDRLLQARLGPLLGQTSVGPQCAGCRLDSLRPENGGVATGVGFVCTFRADPAGPGPDREQLYWELSQLTHGVNWLGRFSLDRDSLYVDGERRRSSYPGLSTEDVGEERFTVNFTIDNLRYSADMGRRGSVKFNITDNVLRHLLGPLFQRSCLGARFSDCSVTALRPVESGAKTGVDVLCKYLQPPRAPRLPVKQVFYELSWQTRGITRLGLYSLDKDSLYLNGYNEPGPAQPPTTPEPLTFLPPSSAPARTEATTAVGQKLKSFRLHFAVSNLPCSLGPLLRKSSLGPFYTGCRRAALRPEEDGAATRVDVTCTYDSAGFQLDRERLYWELSQLTLGAARMGRYSLVRGSLSVDGFAPQGSPTQHEYQIDFRIVHRDAGSPGPAASAPQALLWDVQDKVTALFSHSQLRAVFRSCVATNVTVDSMLVTAKALFSSNVDPGVVKRVFLAKTLNASAHWLGATYQLADVRVTEFSDNLATEKPTGVPSSQHFQLNFTVTNLLYSQDMAQPGASKHQKTKRSIEHALNQLFQNSSIRNYFSGCQVLAFRPVPPSNHTGVDSLCDFSPLARKLDRIAIYEEFLRLTQNGTRLRNFTLDRNSVLVDGEAPSQCVNQPLCGNMGLPFWAIILLCLAGLLVLITTLVCCFLFTVCLRKKEGNYEVQRRRLGHYLPHLDLRKLP